MMARCGWGMDACIPVATRGADQVVNREGEDRQAVVLVVLLGLGRVPLVLGVRVRDLVYELDPVFRLR